jgi:hypothetical protein
LIQVGKKGLWHEAWFIHFFGIELSGREGSKQFGQKKEGLKE